MLPRCDKSRTCGIGIEYILFPCHFHIVTVFPFANRMHPLETASPLIYNRNLIPATTSNQKLFTSILLPERKRGILQFDCLYSTGNQTGKEDIQKSMVQKSLHIHSFSIMTTRNPTLYTF